MFVALGHPHRQRIVLMFEPGGAPERRADRRRVHAVALGGRPPSQGAARGRRAARREGRQGGVVSHRSAGGARCAARVLDYLANSSVTSESSQLPGRTRRAASWPGCDISLADGVFNRLRHATARCELRTHALVAVGAGTGSTPTRCGTCTATCSATAIPAAASGSTRSWSASGSRSNTLQRMFYMNAGCVHDRRARSTRAWSIAWCIQCAAMPAGFHAILFAFDWARDEAGSPVPRALDVPRPGRLRRGTRCAVSDSTFEWAASIHPYDPRHSTASMPRSHAARGR